MRVPVRIGRAELIVAVFAATILMEGQSLAITVEEMKGALARHSCPTGSEIDREHYKDYCTDMGPSLGYPANGTFFDPNCVHKVDADNITIDAYNSALRDCDSKTQSAEKPTISSPAGNSPNKSSDTPDLSSLINDQKNKAANADAINQQNKQQVIEGANQDSQKIRIEQQTKIAQCVQSQAFCNHTASNPAQPSLAPLYTNICFAREADCAALAMNNATEHQNWSQVVQELENQLQSEIAAEARRIPAGWLRCACPEAHRGIGGKWVDGVFYHPPGPECP